VYNITTEMRRLGGKGKKLTRYSRNRAFISCYTISILYNSAYKRSCSQLHCNAVYNENKNGHSTLSLSLSVEMAPVI